MIHDGQQFAEPLHYSPLSKSAVQKSEAILRSVVFDGSPLLK